MTTFIPYLALDGRSLAIVGVNKLCLSAGSSLLVALALWFARISDSLSLGDAWQDFSHMPRTTLIRPPIFNSYIQNVQQFKIPGN